MLDGERQRKDEKQFLCLLKLNFILSVMCKGDLYQRNPMATPIGTISIYA